MKRRKYLVRVWGITNNKKVLLEEKIVETDKKLYDHFEERKNLMIYTEVQEIKDD